MSRPPMLLSMLLVSCLLAAACGAPRRAPDVTPPDADALLHVRAEILRAEDRRLVDEPLLAALDHPDAETRAAAVRALGRIGDPGTRVRIEAALDDEDEHVAADAARALGFSRAVESLPLLLRATESGSAVVRAGAAFALGLIGDAAAEDALARLLADEDGAVVEAACFAVSRFDTGGFAVDGLLAHFDDPDPRVRFAAVYALAQLSARSTALGFSTKTDVRRKLMELADSPDASARLFVARGLNVPSGDEEATVLGGLSADSDPTVRVEAVRSFSFPGAPIAPFLSKTIGDGDDRVVLATIVGLSRMRGVDVNETLAKLVVFDKRPWARVAATLAMAGADPDAGAAMANGISGDEDPRVRAAAATLVAGRTDDTALKIGRRLFADADPDVRREAIPALAGVPEPLAEALGETATSSDAGVRAAVARAAELRLALDDRTAEDRESTLALLESLWDDSPVAQSAWSNSAVLRAAVAAGGTPTTRRLLERALASSWYHLRVDAAKGLERLFGEDRSAAIGAAADLPLEDYLEVLRWAERPHAAIITVERPGFVPGRFTVWLDSRSTPMTAWRFAQMAEAGDYSGVELGRVLPNVSLQSGDPFGTGPGGPGPTLRDEPNPHPFGTGTLAMIADGRDRADGRWFITLTPQPQLSGRRTAFGGVVRNFAGVVARLFPGDRVVAVEVYEGDGTEEIPPPSP